MPFVLVPWGHKHRHLSSKQMGEDTMGQPFPRHGGDRGARDNCQ